MDFIVPALLLAASKWMRQNSGPRDLSQRAPPPPAPEANLPPGWVPYSAPPTARPPAPGTPAPSPAVPVSYSTPEWPQVVPGGLPGFPGPGWELDKPVGPGVASRAMELLPKLWRSGAGTFKTEMTAGRWVTYRAVSMGAKKGVVAYRLTEQARSDLPSGRSQTDRMVSDTVPAGYSTPAASSPLGLPTLRRGNKGPSVVALQQRLGIEADGDFGPKTEQAVIAFQRSHGLAVDGVVGKNTWIALTGARDPMGYSRA